MRAACAAVLVTLAAPALAQHGRHGASPADPHAAHRPPEGTDRPAGDAPAPAPFPPEDHGAMAAARRALYREHGGATFRQLIFNLAEVRAGGEGGRYRWDGEGWIGGDIHRLVVRTEGAGDAGGGTPDDAELQLVYSRALDPYVNLRAGVRYDLRPDPSRAHASIGLEALAPLFFDVEATVFVSTGGEVLARAEAYHDLRITNWIVLQPRVELNVAAQDAPATGVGAGLSDIELGLRLRYEIAREVAPYVGLSWDRSQDAGGRTAASAGVVAGLRLWL